MPRHQQTLLAPEGTRPDGRTAVLERPGARLVYEVAGDGPAVVLIHGFGLDMRMWDPQIEPLAARFQVVRYDCRGFGASGPFDPAAPYTHAGDLIALLDQLGIDDAVVAGLSFGGRVALQAALADPARVRGLALLGAVLDGVPWDPESARALDEVAARVQAAGVLAGREAWLAQDPHRQTRQPVDVLEGVTVPVLVAVGERDVPGFREMSAVLARRIPCAAYRLVPDAGHMINMEQPAAVNELLTRFIQDNSAQ